MVFYSLSEVYSPDRGGVGPPPLNNVGSKSNLAVGSWPCSVGSWLCSLGSSMYM